MDLTSLYFWIKSGHVVAVIAWMAGLLYLPRLYVYHVEVVKTGTATDELFQTMERRLLRAIMHPALVVSWSFGLLLVLTPGVVDWSQSWPWVKGACVLAMTGFHVWLAVQRRRIAEGRNRLGGRAYRVMNEVPTLLMIGIVISVIVKF